MNTGSDPHGFRFGRGLVLVCLLLSADTGLALGSTGRTAGPLSPQQITEIRELGMAVLTREGLPGLSIAVAKGTQVWGAGFGSADLEQNVSVDTRSLFRTASIAKWLTATAAMRLVEERRLNLDAPIQQYCPQYPQKKWPVTSRELLTHLSGIRHYHGANGEPRDTEAERRALDGLIEREQSTQYTRYTDTITPLDSFKSDSLVFQPGTRFLYTSLGYRVLACVMEGAAHISYRTLMRQLVFIPAGMAGITEDDAEAVIPHRVAGYSRGAAKQLIHAPFRDISANLPAGGYLATPEDLVRFAAAFNEGRLVRASTRDLMIQRPRLLNGNYVPDAPPYFGMGTGLYYGMGVFVGHTSRGELLLLHTGRDPGASTELLLEPESGIAVAVMTNLSGWEGGDRLAKQILGLARQSSRMIPPGPPDE